MTYQEFISQVADEVRDNAWPQPDADVTQEQLDISWAAVLAIASGLPIQMLDKTEETLQGSSATVGNGYLSYSLPADLFDVREDHGIYHHTFNSVEHDPTESLPINALRAMAQSSFYSDEDGYFSINARDKTLNILSTDNTKDVTLNYVPEPTAPKDTTGNADSYDTLTLPLPPTEINSAKHLVASHISGSRMRDGAGSQLQAILSGQYSSIKPLQAQPE